MARGNIGKLEGTHSHHDVVRRVLAVRRLQQIAIALALHGSDFHAKAHGRIEAGSVPLQIIDDLVASQETVRIISIVGKSGQLQLPVGRYQRERFPASPPAGAYLFRLLQDNVLTALLSQQVARGQPRLPPAYYDRVNAFSLGRHIYLPYSTNVLLRVRPRRTYAVCIFFSMWASTSFIPCCGLNSTYSASSSNHTVCPGGR